MAKISIETINEELSTTGWKLLSSVYKNLDEELMFQCPEGHTVYNNWKKMRSSLSCPVCKSNSYKDIKNIVSTKPKGIYRILSLDQATHTTGWAVFDSNKLVNYGTFITSTESEASRLFEIKQWLLSVIENWTPDEIAIEGIQYQQNFGVTTFQTLARLQGILMLICYELGIKLKICPTNTWRAHCNVKGKTRADKKKSMQLLIKQWFDISVQDDISDAIGIGKYAAETRTSQMEVINWE